MKRISQWIKDFANCDAHIHLVGSEMKPIASSCVCLVNWLPYDKKKSINKLIKSYKPRVKDIVLANGLDEEDLKKSLDDKSLQGIGEINYKKNYTLPGSDEIKIYENHKLLTAALKDGRPIYLHWDLVDDSDVEKLGNILSSHPDVKINLCHLGGNYYLQNKSAIEKFIKLQDAYPNLWGDISWATLTWIQQDTRPLFDMDLNRIMVGSDLCRDGEEFAKQRQAQLRFFQDFIDTEKNMKNFFKR